MGSLRGSAFILRWAFVRNSSLGFRSGFVVCDILRGWAFNLDCCLGSIRLSFRRRFVVQYSFAVCALFAVVSLLLSQSSLTWNVAHGHERVHEGIRAHCNIVCI